MSEAHPTAPRTFASDNNSGICPEALAAIQAANAGHARAYGDDAWTARAEAAFRREFGPASESFLVFNGTGANVLSLMAMTRPHHAVICAEGAHIAVDECGAPERLTGCKLLTVAPPDGRLTPALVESRLQGRGDQHHVQPRVVSITQSTEVGTVYRPEQVRALAECCRRHDLLLHMDGARLANAAAALGTTLAGASGELGVDVLSLGGTKNGLLNAEAVVFFRAELARDFRFRRKQSMQLASKMRYAAAQFEAFLGAAGESAGWRRHAERANAMARRLAEGLRAAGARLAQEPQANAVFAILDPAVTTRLHAESFFYVWDEPRGIVRLVCSWDTDAADVDAFVASYRRAQAPAR